jgi:integration host factor subunit alpha
MEQAGKAFKVLWAGRWSRSPTRGTHNSVEGGRELYMTKVDIVENIYEKVGYSKSDVAKIVETVFDIIKETLRHEDKIMVSGFGEFVIRKKRARRGRNPQTGCVMEISSRRILTFKPSPVLKASLNEAK